MEKWTLGELVNLNALQAMTDNLYAAAEIPVGILDADGTVLVASGWKDICVNFRSLNSSGSQCCKFSAQCLKQNPSNSDIEAYKCTNNMWEVFMPIIVEEVHIASIVIGQFFYEDEPVNVDVFLKQARELGYNETQCIASLQRIPVFSREKVKKILEYYKGLVITLVESSIAKLQYMRINTKYKRLFNSMQEFVFILDSSKRFIECNKPMDENLHLHIDEFIGKKFYDVLPSHHSALLEDAILRLEKENEIPPFDYSLMINNKERWYSAQVSKVKLEIAGESDSYMIVSRDITQRKYLLDEYRKAKQQAEEANNAKSTFVANISHELRTPITVVQSATQLFELKCRNRLNEDSSYCNYLKIIKQNCSRLLRLINNLIDVTKVDAGFMNLHLQNLNIVDLVEKITLSVAAYAKEKNLNVIFNKNINEKTIAVDPDKMERILLNLLSNAIKFTEKNKYIIVSIFERNSEVIISVKDTGIGISKEKIGQIFERFNQINNIFSRSHEGSGIGLSLVKSFVDMHGGTIAVESELGKGSEFIVKLPVKKLDYEQGEHSDSIIIGEPYVERLKVEFSDIYM